MAYNLPLTLKGIQFPVKVQFVVTINKAQGQTFKHVGIDLRQDCFTQGRLYVALSRSGCGENEYVLLPQENKTKNIVQATQQYFKMSPNKNTSNYIHTYILHTHILTLPRTFTQRSFIIPVPVTYFIIVPRLLIIAYVPKITSKIIILSNILEVIEYILIGFFHKLTRVKPKTFYIIFITFLCLSFVCLYIHQTKTAELNLKD